VGQALALTVLCVPYSLDSGRPRTVFADSSQVYTLGLWYKSVNLGAQERSTAVSGGSETAAIIPWSWSPGTRTSTDPIPSTTRSCV
jgi:hypothetical protein